MQRPRHLCAGRRQDRGVSETIGFILIFAILLISWSIYQGLEVPNQNAKAEFEHNKRVQRDLLNLRDAITRSATTGLSQTVSITVGADYPERTLAVNFGVPGGSVETVEPVETGPNNITIKNANAAPGNSELGDYWNVSVRSVRTHDIVYKPTYTRYGDAPDTVLSNTAAFNQFQNTNLPLADQIVINGDTITLIAINGSLNQAKSGESATVTVDTEALSPIERSITIEDDPSTTDKITIKLPTSVAEKSAWDEASLESQANVSSVTVGNDNVTITLKDGSYTLKMAQIGVGSNTQEPGAAYIIPIDTPDSLSENTKANFTFEVRDRFNNPVEDVIVNATEANNNGKFVDKSDRRTNDEGRVTFTYNPQTSSSVDLTFNLSTGTNAGNSESWELVNKSYSVGSESSSDGKDYLDVLLGFPQNLRPQTKYNIVLVARNGTNSPVNPAETITASATPLNTPSTAGSFQKSSITTNNNGVVVFNYTTPSKDADRVTFTFEFDGTTEDRKRVTFTRNITSAEDPLTSDDVVLTSSSKTNTNCGSGNNQADCEVSLTLDNSGDDDKTITEMRVNFYSVESQGQGNDPTKPVTAKVTGGSGTIIDIGGQFANTADLTINSGSSGSFQLKFYEDSSANTPYAVGSNDFFVLTVIFDDGSAATYFVGT